MVCFFFLVFREVKWCLQSHRVVLFSPSGDYWVYEKNPFYGSCSDKLRISTKIPILKVTSPVYEIAGNGGNFGRWGLLEGICAFGC